MLGMDAAAAPRGRFFDRPGWAHLLAVAGLATLWSAWFAISWRPYFATHAAVVTYAIVVTVSNFKNREVAEPLDFSDFLLVGQVLRHPTLYSAEFLRHTAFKIVVGVTVAMVALWCIFIEPSVLPPDRLWPFSVGGVLALCALAWLWLRCPVPGILARGLAVRLLPADPARQVRAVGLAASILGNLLGWRGNPSGTFPTRPPLPAVRSAVSGPKAPVVIVVQSESFVDLREAGLLDVDLAAFADARRRSFGWGRLTVPVQGAWTLRSDISFLTGRPIEDFGFDALHPYARLGAPPRSLSRIFSEAGYRTTFVHPFDLTFFRRHHALPALGFGELVGESAFDPGDRDGWYVGDAALAKRVIEMAAADSSPLFCLIATMENHNPWRLGRVPGVDSPVDQYVHHLRNADRMLKTLMDGLDELGRPAVLTFYGDHVPILPRLADPFPDVRTDYVTVAFGGADRPTVGRRDLAIHELAGLTLKALESVTQ